MTFGGIIDSIIATAIWAVIGSLYYIVRKKFEEDEAFHKKLKELVAEATSKKMDISVKLDLIIYVNIVRDKYKQNLIKLYFSEVILILYIFIFSEDKTKLIFIIIYIILLLFIWFFTRRMQNRLSDFDLAILESVNERINTEVQ